MKKLIALILCIAVCFALGGCSKTPNPVGKYISPSYNTLDAYEFDFDVRGVSCEYYLEIEKADEDYTFLSVLPDKTGTGTAKVNTSDKLVCKYDGAYGENGSEKYIFYKNYLIADNKMDIEIVQGNLPTEGKNRDCVIHVNDRIYESYQLSFSDDGIFEIEVCSSFLDRASFYTGTYKVDEKIITLNFEEFRRKARGESSMTKLDRSQINIDRVLVYVDGNDLYDRVFVKQ